jgi:hypothetical protein
MGIAQTANALTPKGSGSNGRYRRRASLLLGKCEHQLLGVRRWSYSTRTAFREQTSGRDRI